MATEVLVRATHTDAQFQLIDFRLAFVMLIGMVYGLNAGVLAAALASLPEGGLSAPEHDPAAVVLRAL